jgi:hypothetical protein
VDRDELLAEVDGRIERFAATGEPAAVLDPQALALARQLGRSTTAAWKSPAKQPPARALHAALHRLRRRYGTSPYLWASHVHIGP